MNRIGSSGSRLRRARSSSDPWWITSPRVVRDRQLAVQYLWTADRTADEGARQLLRRRAAELVLPRLLVVGTSWTRRAFGGR